MLPEDWYFILLWHFGHLRRSMIILRLLPGEHLHQLHHVPELLELLLYLLDTREVEVVEELLGEGEPERPSAPLPGDKSQGLQLAHVLVRLGGAHLHHHRLQHGRLPGDDREGLQHALRKLGLRDDGTHQGHVSLAHRHFPGISLADDEHGGLPLSILLLELGETAQHLCVRSLHDARDVRDRYLLANREQHGFDVLPEVAHLCLYLPEVSWAMMPCSRNLERNGASWSSFTPTIPERDLRSAGDLCRETSTRFLRRASAFCSSTSFSAWRVLTFMSRLCRPASRSFSSPLSSGASRPM